MQSPGLVILAVFAVGAIFVLIPIALTSLAENRHARSLQCPEAGQPAAVRFDAARAMRGALVGRVWLDVTDCSLWPQRSGCAQACKAPQAPAPPVPAD